MVVSDAAPAESASKPDNEAFSIPSSLSNCNSELNAEVLSGSATSDVASVDALVGSLGLRIAPTISALQKAQIAFSDTIRNPCIS